MEDDRDAREVALADIAEVEVEIPTAGSRSSFLNPSTATEYQESKS